jgi:hypothetical protein
MTRSEIDKFEQLLLRMRSFVYEYTKRSNKTSRSISKQTGLDSSVISNIKHDKLQTQLKAETLITAARGIKGV